MQTMEQPAHRIEEGSAPLWFGSGPTAWGDVVQAVDPAATKPGDRFSPCDHRVGRFGLPDVPACA